MSSPRPALEELERNVLVAMAYEYMLTGMLVTRAMLPQVVLRGSDMDAMNQVAIDEWMGASPVYTRRMRQLMGIEGDDVEAIMKALQLDVGFVHEYMDVAYRLVDERHGEFWLDHCGALLDAEPHGEEQVFGMCHTIEDPTFDATAYATNPRARIRPVHRPPRRPADRHPHCHWTIEIDPLNEPVGPARLTDQVAALPLAAVANEPAGAMSPGLSDYRGPFRPTFRLGDLASGALAAVAREFQVQSHLLVCSWHLAVRDRFGAEAADEMASAAWVGSGWVVSERLGRLLGATGSAADLGQVLVLHPLFPPGFERSVEVDDQTVEVLLRPVVPGLAAADHPGVPGLLGRADRRGVEAMVQAVAPTAAVELTIDDGGARVTVDTAPGREPATLPDAAALTQIGAPASWTFSARAEV